MSRSDISSYALKVLYRLKDSGFAAYLVGGGVRDLLLGFAPKDFDVATDATPEQVKATFRNCRLIGRRFRLAHVHFGREIVEVATFRGSQDNGDGDRHLENGRLVRDNVFGDIEEDARRRDFTVNALFYNIRDFSVCDYVGGFEDLKARRLRLIGEPRERYTEDPVRMLRAIRFSIQLNLTISPESEAPMEEMGHLLAGIAPARLFDELLKLLLGGHGAAMVRGMEKYGLLQHLFPDTVERHDQEGGIGDSSVMMQALRSTDQRIHDGRPVTPAFILAAMLWLPMWRRAEKLMQEGATEYESLLDASEWIVARQVQRVAIPRRLTHVMKEIWLLQPRFQHRIGKRVRRLLSQPRFRAAYDFLLLRSGESQELKVAGDWWTRLQTLDNEALAKEIAPPRGGRRRPRRRKPKVDGG